MRLAVTTATTEFFIPARYGRLHAIEFHPASAIGTPAQRAGAAAPPLICVHGVTGHAWIWHDVAQALSEKRRVIALDLRGHGDSQWSAKQAYGTEQHVEDLHDAVTALGLEHFDFAGASWGALAGIAYAARYPGRMRRFAVIDVEPSFSQRETEVMPRPEWFESADAVLEWERKANPNAPESLLTLHAMYSVQCSERGGFVRKHDPFFFKRWPFRNDNCWDALRALDLPLLFVHGEKSFVRGEVMEEMARIARQGQILHVENSGHLIPLEAPAMLSAALHSFL